MLLAIILGSSQYVTLICDFKHAAGAAVECFRMDAQGKR